MRSYDILFDREKKELHFTKANCSGEGIGKLDLTEIGKLIRTTKEDTDYINLIEESNEDNNGGENIEKSNVNNLTILD